MATSTVINIMRFAGMAVLTFASTMCFISGADSALCPPVTAAVTITSKGDVQNLTDALSCEGEGVFNITWYSSVTIDEGIEVFDRKHVTVTGASSSRFDGGLGGDNADGVVIDAGSGTAIFSVSDGSTLRLNNLVLYGGNAENGGAVDVRSSSSLFAVDCIFMENNASNGGALFASNSTIVVNGSTSFTDNSALFGGVDSITYFNSYWSGTTLVSHGGAVYGVSSEIIIDGNATFANNGAGGDGGAVYGYYSEMSIDGNATFANNRAGGDGGAVCDAHLGMSIDGNATFANNRAGGNAGAVYGYSSEMSIDGNATFANNSAGDHGGAVYGYSSEMCIDGNATFANNRAGGDGGAVDVFDSEISIHGNANFANNIAGRDGGAIDAFQSNLTITGRDILCGGFSGFEGGLHSNSGGEYTDNWGVEFVGNYADGFGGAIDVSEADQVEVSNVIWMSNKALLGGAVYLVAVDDKQTMFKECVFESNEAADGGAVYLYTGPGVDIFTASVFRNNFAETSGGAIFHTGSMRVFNTTFVANKAGVEGPGVMSVGVLEMSNVSFSENAYFCRDGEYGYLNETKDYSCRSCFDEVCSRCSTVGDGVSIPDDVRINEEPVCAEPPLGVIAPSEGTTVANITLEKGYFRTSDESHVILRCYQKNACQGGSDADQYCAPGYIGPYCAVCSEGFAPGIAYSCRECTRATTISTVGLAVALGLAVLLFAALLVSRMGSVPHSRTEEVMAIDRSLWNKCWSCGAFLVNMLPLVAIKIVVTVWQIVSQFDAIAGDVYPELYQKFVSKLNLVNLDLDFVFAYSCLVTNDFYDHLLFATITPFLALVVLAGSYFIGKTRNSSSESAMLEVRHKHQAAVLYVALLVYSPVSYRIFQTFGCDELDDGESYLRADYSLSCLTGRHRWYEIYAFIMVGVYPIGIAAALAGLLFWHRRDLVKPERGTILHLKPSNGVWAAYSPSQYYYEVVECGRRISFTVIAAFVRANSAAQVSIAFLFAVVFVFISEVLSPFQKGADTMLYRWGNGVIVASMYVAFLTKVVVSKEEKQYALLTFSGVLILANVFMVVAVVVEMVFLAKQVLETTNSVREVDRPVRNTNSMSVRDVRPPNEGGVEREGDAALESKDSDLSGDERKT